VLGETVGGALDEDETLGALALCSALVPCLLEHAVSATPARDATTTARVVQEGFT
jgi:hypothetical protein